MPSAYVKKLAKETGKSEREIEKVWKKAKKITSEEFGKDEDDFGRKEYAYTSSVVKTMIGVDESILDPSNFLESDMNARDYLETVVSGNFSVGNVVPPEEEELSQEKKEDEDEDDENFDYTKYESEEEEPYPQDESIVVNPDRVNEDVSEKFVDAIDKFLDEELK